MPRCTHQTSSTNDYTYSAETEVITSLAWSEKLQLPFVYFFPQKSPEHKLFSVQIIVAFIYQLIIIDVLSFG